MTAQEALSALYDITRRVNLPAEGHDKLKQCYEVVKAAIDKGEGYMKRIRQLDKEESEKAALEKE